MKATIALLKHTGLFATALLLMASLSWSGTAAAAACESTNYDLNTQRDVDALGATGCDSVVGYMVITEWADITNLDGLANLTSVGGDLSIGNNDALTNLDGLANLTSVGGDLQIVNNDVLTSLEGLANLASVGGGLVIGYHSNLTSLEGLANLTSVGGELVIYNNSALISIGLANITSVGGYLQITDNDLLYAIFLANLTSVGDHLSIGNNFFLTNLDGLANLTSVGGDLQINDNFFLTNLDGLANLTSVGGNLYIYDNDALTNLDGLANITSVGRELVIEWNPTLANCEGVALLLGAPNGPPDDSVNGDIFISRNATGCNSIAEVLASYTPPSSISVRFKALLQAVQNIRGAGRSQQQTTSESSSDVGEAKQLTAQEGATIQARAVPTAGEPASIPAMPHYLMLMMVGLVSLFGLRRLRA